MTGGLDVQALSREELVAHALALETILAIAEAVHGSSDFPDLVERAVDAIVTYARYPSIALFRVNREERCLDLVAMRGFGEGVSRLAKRLPLEGSLTGEAVRARRILTSADLAKDPRVEPAMRQALEHEGFVEVASVPVFFRDNVIGALNLIYKGASGLTEHQRFTLRAIAQTIGLAMHNRLAEEERRSLEERLSHTQRLESLGVLAGGIAHDFNNLLTGIALNIGLAKHSVSDPEADQLLTEAAKASEQAAGLVRQLLTFSRGGAPLKRPTADIVEVVRDAAEFAPRGTSTRVEVLCQGTIGTVELDPTQLAQVVQNLVLNAAQASAEGGVVTVTLRHEELEAPPAPLAPGSYLRLTVEDRGKGIPAEHLPRIFDPFFTTRSGGTGLGLATTHSIVLRHGGSIQVQSQVGRGSCFTVLLPAPPAEARSDVCAGETLPVGIRVLVVDDDDAVRRVALRVLDGLGAVAAGAANYAEAVEVFAKAVSAERPFHVVVLDLTLVGSEGGTAILEAIRRIDPGVRAVASSGYSADAVMASASKYGFAGVLPKPYTPFEMVSALKEALRRGAAP